jgi:predicted alpha-1,2-mannosidase
MDLNRFDTRLATRATGVTARSATRPWGFGNIAPGPCLPHGSAHPGPNTDCGRSNGYDPTRPIRGFAQIHVSGTGGSGKYGNFLLSPQLGLAIGEEAHDSPKADEIATPGYYAVTLTRYGIRVEITATHCCALYRITFPESREASLDLDLAHNIPGDAMRREGWPVAGNVAWQADGRHLAGSGRYHGGWGPTEYQAHCVAEISAAPAAFGTWSNGVVGAGPAVATGQERDRIGAWWRKPTRAGEQVLVKFGVSVRDQAASAAHLARELPGWDFDAVRAAAEAVWERALGCIRLEGVDPSEEAYFYAALRNAMVMPRDRSMEHPAAGSRAPYWDEFYCSWDIFRTVMPLMTLVDPGMVRDCLASFVDRLDRGGLVTDAFINGQDLVGGMGGEMTDVIIADAVAKEVPGVDVAAVYRVLRHHAEQGRCPVYRELGWIPCDRLEVTPTSRVHCPSSTSIEMNYTDWCAARVAAKLGLDADATRYRRRSRNWRELFNPDMEAAGFRGFLSARQADGVWRDELAWADGKAFAEETAWEYAHFVPHEIPAVIELCGGPDAWVRRIEHTLDVEKIRLDNEPTFLLIHTLCYAGRPDLCSFRTRRFLDEWYDEEAYPGPDDSGAMAAWYVFGRLGLFPNAGQDLYLLHGPTFPKATLRLEHGREFIVLGVDAAPDRPFVVAAALNGRPLDRPWLRHRKIVGGGVLEFHMSDRAGDWGRGRPPGESE